jgi:small subunit ribosomal protein S20
MANDKKQEKKERKPSALKRDQQSERRRIKNKQFRATVKTAIKSLESSLKEKQVEVAKDKLSQVFSLMDKGVKTGVFTKNKANRTKSRLGKHV